MTIGSLECASAFAFHGNSEYWACESQAIGSGADSKKQRFFSSSESGRTSNVFFTRVTIRARGRVTKPRYRLNSNRSIFEFPAIA